jgi:phosphate transport system protein
MSKHLQNDLEKLKRHILAIGALVEESVENATHAFCARDIELAKKVILDEKVVDEWEVNVEEECLKLLALYQPVAQDLRFIASTIKVNSDLERMSDYCVKISKRTLSLSKEAPIEIPDNIQRMIQVTKKMVRDSLDAFSRRDATHSRQICVQDDEVDALQREMIKFLRESIQKEPKFVDQFLDLLTVTQGIERIADLATNIAQDVVYMVEGEIIRHKENQYPRKS